MGITISSQPFRALHGGSRSWHAPSCDTGYVRYRRPRDHTSDLLSSRLRALAQVLLIALLLLSLWISRDPQGSNAQENSLATVEAIMQQADQAISQSSWLQAQAHLERAYELADETRRGPISQSLQWCQARGAVQDRHRDESLAQYVRSATALQAQTQLTETLDLITQYYHQPFDVKEALSKSLLQLQAATQSAEFCRQFEIDPTALAALRNQIKKQRDELDQCDIKAVLATAYSLCDYSDKAGLGPSWPATELAYAFADSLDKYSYLLSPPQYEALRQRLNGAYVGFGVDLVFPAVYPMVFDVVKQSPADQAGLMPGDVLLQADGISCADKPAAEVSKLLTGSRYSKVSVRIKRAENEFEINLHRDIIVAPSVRQTKILDGDSHIGYFRVSSFDHDTAWEMRRTIDDLLTRGVESLMIDLRHNGGGVMTAAIEATRLFLDEGTIVTVKSAEKTTRYCAGGEDFHSYKLPLVILVNENTASAAEIFAAALQDHQRATVIGQKTFGKNAVQTIYRLDHAQTAVCLTTASYSRPRNIDAERPGVTPDILIESPQDQSPSMLCVADFLTARDPAFHAALKQL